MSYSQVTGRRAVREFFTFNLDNKDLTPRAARYKPAAWLALMGACTGGVIQGAPTALVFALIGFALAVAADRNAIQRDVRERTAEKNMNHQEFARLARETRMVQGADVLKALLRVFERTSIQRSELQNFDERYVFQQELSLFDEQTLEQKVGDLINKSIRMISKGSYSNDVVRTVRWLDTRTEEFFFNPIRLVALFLTDSQLVVCDVEIDSIDGDLREEIQRISLAKVVNIIFRAERMRFPMKQAALEKEAKRMGYTDAEIKNLGSGPDAIGSWICEDITSRLTITRTDGGTLSAPIRSERYFGKHRSALDQESLHEDEVKIDRMLNELNRKVEHQGVVASPRATA